MHPRQASLLTRASEVAERTAVKQGAAAQTTLMWQYKDPDGNVFYLPKRKTTIKSPFTGKSFTTMPTRFTPNQLIKEVKEQAAEAKGKGQEPPPAAEEAGEKKASDLWK